MPPIAVPKSVEFFNRLADLKLGDHDAAMGMLFELRKRARIRPGDPLTRVSLSHACLIVGYRAEALEHLKIADGLWGAAEISVKMRIADLNGFLGNKDRALLQANELLKQQVNVGNLRIIANAAVSALRYGDIDLLERLQAREEAMLLPPRAISFYRILDDLGLISCFSAIQATLSEAVAPYVMGFEFDMSVHPDDGRPFLSMSLQIDASLIHSIDLGNDVSDRLDALAQERDDMPADWWWRYMVTVDSAPRHPSIPAAPRRRQAA